MRASQSPALWASPAVSHRAKAGAKASPTRTSTRSPGPNASCPRICSGSCASRNWSAPWSTRPTCCGRDECEHGVGECRLLAGRRDRASRDPRELDIDGATHERALAVEVAIERGPRAPRFTSDVVEGGLRQPEPGDAHEQCLDGALLDTGRPTMGGKGVQALDDRHSVRQYTTLCLIVEGRATITEGPTEAATSEPDCCRRCSTPRQW